MIEQHKYSKVAISAICFGIILLAAVGCEPSKKAEEAALDIAKPDVSNVPLRVWIVSTVSDPQTIRRQWLGDSDQPIEIQALTTEEFLAKQSCQCELVLFPSRLLGELVHRKWISKLPPSSAEGEQRDEDFVDPTPAALAQTSSDGITYGVALGCSIPRVLASSTLAEALNGDQEKRSVGWPKILSQISQGAFVDVDDAEVDPSALVDRFLAIVATFAQNESKYGYLFDMQTMQSRLKEPEFVSAAEILKKLSLQEGGAVATLGSHDAAWSWVTQSGDKAVAIASPTGLSAEAMQMTGGGLLEVEGDQGWNTGGGLVAALSTECKQSSRSATMLRWLGERKSRDAIAPVVVGADSVSPLGGANALSWIARQRAQMLQGNSALAREPSLPYAEMYRAALAKGLLKFIRSNEDAPQVMSAVHDAWSEIAGQAGAEHRMDYEKSLGLTL